MVNPPPAVVESSRLTPSKVGKSTSSRLAPFEGQEHVDRLLTTAHAVATCLGNAVRSKMTLGRMFALRALKRAGEPLRYIDLARALGCSPQNVTALVTRLRADRLVDVFVSGGRYRTRSEIVLTAVGREFLAKAEANSGRRAEALMEMLSPAELAVLPGLLDKLKEATELEWDTGVKRVPGYPVPDPFNDPYVAHEAREMKAILDPEVPEEEPVPSPDEPGISFHEKRARWHAMDFKISVAEAKKLLLIDVIEAEEAAAAARLAAKEAGAKETTERGAEDVPDETAEASFTEEEILAARKEAEAALAEETREELLAGVWRYRTDEDVEELLTAPPSRSKPSAAGRVDDRSRSRGGAAADGAVADGADGTGGGGGPDE